MADVELLGRRQLLLSGARGAAAVAILGPSVVACASNGEDAAVLVPTTTTPETGSTTTNPGSTTSVSTTDDGSTGSDTNQLEWQRVSFGSVSAFVLARANRVAIIDTGNPGNLPNIEAALSELGQGWDSVDHVVLTHLHGDHIGSLPEVLAAAETAVAYAGEADVEGIPSPRPLTAVSGGEEIFGLEVIATPGHTPGSISMLDGESGLLVAGDALNTSDGRVTGANPNFSSDLEAANESARLLSERQFDTLAVGHGDPIIGGADDLLAAFVESL